jgi:TonB family protein
MPSFPGGFDSMKVYFDRHYKRPTSSLEYSGKIFVEFVVSENGSITNSKIVRGLCKECDKNALEVVNKMPKWIPAEQNGKPVAVRMVVPITFANY